ncbi:MAG: site-specific DNA-methyltransferase [Treponema sp.]|nr:site-specific DNA-methyltransferase [Treponema sp.]
MPKKAQPPKKTKRYEVSQITHTEDKRKNIPTAEYQAVVEDETKKVIPVTVKRRNPDLDPQLVWRGKEDRDWTSLNTQAPPLYIQEKLHPKAIIDDLVRRSDADRKTEEQQPDLFADFNGIGEAEKTEFYKHEQNWSNRMILGDSLLVMASLSVREDLQGKVQCIYFDPPYGIKFNSNFQWSTTSRDVKDGNLSHISREPEQVKAFRDTWRDGVHSYLSYIRDRLTIARELLAETGSIFVQIGDENVHRVRDVMDEVFGEENFISLIIYKKGGTATTQELSNITDFIIWYAKDKKHIKYRQLFEKKEVGVGESTGERYDQLEALDGFRRPMSKTEKEDPDLIPVNNRAYKLSNPCSQHDNPNHRITPLVFEGNEYFPPNDRQWSAAIDKMYKLTESNRIVSTGKNLAYIMYIDDYPVMPINNIWTDFLLRTERVYVVQTSPKTIQRCILMTTDPGDLVLDPTCGSGTTAYIAEQWGRRWITIDTSRVALALARTRLMGARYPYFLLADSSEGQLKEAELKQTIPSREPTYSRIRHGFVYERVPHITLKSIANNTEIDVIYEKYRQDIENSLAEINTLMRGEDIVYRIETGARKGRTVNFSKDTGKKETLPSGEEVSVCDLLEWEVPPIRFSDGKKTCPPGFEKAIKPLGKFWDAKMKRQKEIDASISAKAEFEYLYDKPYEDNKKIRVAGPFTVESASPHRVLDLDENGDFIVAERTRSYGAKSDDTDFTSIILENLRTAGVQQTHKEDKIDFTSLNPWPGNLVCAEGRYDEGGERGAKPIQRRAAIFIGGEFGTVTRADLVEAANEAAEANFDCLITCAFNYEARVTDFNKLGKIRILKARMNADLHMAGDLRNTGKGNLFVIFGEPDLEIISHENNQLIVKIRGVDVFHPGLGKVESNDTGGIACWFIDTDYNGESFFVRHAYFLGAGNPYESLKKTLNTQINEDAWASLRSDISRPFDKPPSGRIAVKVINHLGDEVMKVINVKER